MNKVMYILGLVFGVFAAWFNYRGLLPYTKFEFTCCLVCDALVEVLWLLCIVYVIRAQPAVSVAQLVRHIASRQSWVRVPPEAAFFFDK